MSSPIKTFLKIAGLSLAGACIPSMLFARIDLGTPFPNLASFAIEGNAPDYSNKVTLVDFWASWCTPCKTSFPALSRIHADYGDRAVIIGVSIDDKSADYLRFLSRYKPNFPTFRDPTQKLVATVEVPTMPTSYLLDRHGIVRFIHVGFHDQTAAELRTEIDQLLKE